MGILIHQLLHKVCIVHITQQTLFCLRKLSAPVFGDKLHYDKSFFLNVSDVCYPYSLLVSYPFLHQTCMVQVHLISRSFMRSTILFIVHLLQQHLMNHAVNQCLKHRHANSNKHVLWQRSPYYANKQNCTRLSYEYSDSHMCVNKYSFYD